MSYRFPDVVTPHVGVMTCSDLGHCNSFRTLKQQMKFVPRVSAPIDDSWLDVA
jgi:hypothetical protein